MMFNFGVGLCRVAPITPLIAYLLDAPLWALIATPVCLLAVGLGLTPKDVDLAAELLKERFGDRVTVVCGVEQMAVVKAEEPS